MHFFRVALPIILPVRGVLGGAFGQYATWIAARGRMAAFTTKAGGPPRRFIFGGSRVGSTRWRIGPTGRRKGRNVQVGFIVPRRSLGFLGRFLAMSATRLIRARLSGRRSGGGCVFLGVEPGRRASTAVGSFFWERRNGARKENSAPGGATRRFSAGRLG